ncbi:MAG: hypothetical protein B7X78_02880, partial [Sphingomonadales bacterium 39-62-4]
WVPLSGNETGLIGYWPFDEENGPLAADLSPTAAMATLRSAPATETRLYSFAASKGERVFFDVLSYTGASLHIRVLDPAGRQIRTSTGLIDLDLSDLPMDGTYTLAIEGYLYNELGAQFSAVLHKASRSEATLVPGVTVTGTVAALQTQAYSFTLADAKQLVFDTLSGAADITWTLRGPRGIEVSARTFRNSDSADLAGSGLLDLPEGDYVIEVAGQGAASGAFSFRLLDIAAATPLTIGVGTSFAFDPANSSRTFRFSAAAGDQLQVVRSDGLAHDAYVRVIDPTGRQVYGPAYFGSDNVFTAAMAGEYTVLVESRYYITSSETYGFSVDRLGNTPPANTSTGTPLVLGSTVNDTLSAAGETDLFTFTTAGPVRVLMDSLTLDASKTWTLVGPRGVETGPWNLRDSDSYDRSGNTVIDLPLAGSYQLRITGSAGAYGFRLLDIAAATPITPGPTTVSGVLTPGRSTAMYRFSGTAGETIVLDAVTGFDGSIRLIDRFGRLAFEPQSFNDRNFVLPTTGEYTLLLEGRIYNGAASDDFAFVLNRPVDPAPINLAFGTSYSGTIAAAGDLQRFRFSLATARLVAFDSLANTPGLSWTLNGPGDAVTRNFTNSDSYESGTFPPVLLEAGEYELVVGGGFGSGAYGFRMLDLAASAQFVAGNGELVQGTPSLPNGTQVFAFAATAGERFAFQNIQQSSRTSLRLIDPAGRDLSGA